MGTSYWGLNCKAPFEGTSLWGLYCEVLFVGTSFGDSVVRAYLWGLYGHCIVRYGFRVMLGSVTSMCDMLSCVGNIVLCVMLLCDVCLSSSWVWTWRSCRRWRKMPVLEMEDWVVWLVNNTLYYASIHKCCCTLLAPLLITLISRLKGFCGCMTNQSEHN